MLIPKPKFHRLAQDAVDQLTKEGITCTPDEILWLQEMADKVVRPTRADELLFLDLPVPCGNILLWPLSIGARLWLEQYGRPWFVGAGDLEELVFAFAMAHSRQPEILASLTSRLKARVKVAFWACKIRATRHELAEAVALCIGQDNNDLIEVKSPKPPKEQIQTSDYGDCVALLCHFYGQSPEHWLWKVPEEECTKLLNKIARLMPTDKQITSDHAKFISLSTFRLVVNHIRKSRKKENRVFLSTHPKGQILKRYDNSV